MSVFLKPHVQYMKGSMHDHQTWPGPALHVIDFLGQKVDFMDQIRNPSFLRKYFFPSRSRGASQAFLSLTAAHVLDYM